MRRQPQFETDDDRDKFIEKDFCKHCLKMFAVLVLFILLLMLIGLTGLHGKAIDAYINALVR